MALAMSWLLCFRKFAFYQRSIPQPVYALFPLRIIVTYGIG